MINEKKKSGKKDACYHKVKSRYSVWPSAYASGALVKCRKKGAKNWGNSRKDEALHAAYFDFALELLEGSLQGDSYVPEPEKKKPGLLSRLKTAYRIKKQTKASRRRSRERMRAQMAADREAEAEKSTTGKQEEPQAASPKDSEDPFERQARMATDADADAAAETATKRGAQETPAPAKPKKRGIRFSVDPNVDAVGSPEEIETIRRRSEREERTARAAARGTTRPKIRYRTVQNPDGTSSLQAIRQGMFKFDPEQFGKSGFLRSGAGFNRAAFSRTGDEKSRYRAILRGIAGTQPLRTARARLERLADRGLVRSGARIRQGLSSFQKGRASQRRNGGNMDFSHTEYQRIGAILAEAKGVMPKKFSVKSGDKSAAGGLTAKGVKRYRAANPGSKLKTAVTTKPSKLKKGSKSAKRRKSFCARMGGMKKRLTSSKTANDPNSRINKALRKWNC